LAVLAFIFYTEIEKRAFFSECSVSFTKDGMRKPLPIVLYCTVYKKYKTLVKVKIRFFFKAKLCIKKLWNALSGSYRIRCEAYLRCCTIGFIEPGCCVKGEFFVCTGMQIARLLFLASNWKANLLINFTIVANYSYVY
jgi:hypothetical protein